MAIETSARQGGFCHDSRFIKGMDIALIDADVATHFVAGSDTAIGQTVIIQPIRTHHHLEILILLPLAILTGTDGKRDAATDVLLSKLMPVFHIEVSPFTTDMQFSALASFCHDIHHIYGITFDIEVHRSNISRNGHPNIVWIDTRLTIHHGRILNRWSTCGYPYPYGDESINYLFHSSPPFCLLIIRFTYSAYGEPGTLP